MQNGPQITFDGFLAACRLGDLPEVERGIETLSSKEFIRNAYYALRVASENGHLAVVNRLLQIDAVRTNILADNNGALCWAVENGRYGVAARLLKEPIVLVFFREHQAGFVKENKPFLERACPVIFQFTRSCLPKVDSVAASSSEPALADSEPALKRARNE